MKPSRNEHLKMLSHGLSDVGLLRHNNQDVFLISDLHAKCCVQLLLVADGMGGHASGEVASAISAATIETHLKAELPRFQNDEQATLQALSEAFEGADARLFAHAENHPRLAGLGTTMTLALVLRSRLFVAHAGDSRCYLHRAGQLQQLTTDHTVAAEMLRLGTLSEEDQKACRYQNVVTNVLGGNETGVTTELARGDLARGDVLLLCSDGLTGMVPDTRIAEILNQSSEAARACERLIAEANNNGGTDNVTAVVATIL